MPLQAVEATTIVAVRWTRGVVLTGDKQITMPDGKKELFAFGSKLCPIDDYTALGIAGSPAPALDIARNLRSAITAIRNQYSQEVSVEMKLDMMKKSVQQLLPSALQHQELFLCTFVLTFYDLLSSVSRIFVYTPDGFGLEKERYGTAGAGSEMAEGYLREQGNALTEQDALRQALRSLLRASKHGSTTSDPRQAVDAIAITGHGLKIFTPEQIKEVL